MKKLLQKKLLHVSVFLPAMLLAVSARAALVTVDFTVTVTDADPDTGVSVGDILTGSYTYDDATPGILTLASMFIDATMDYPSALTDMQIDINGTAFGATDGDIQYRDGGGSDYYTVHVDDTTYGELNPNLLLTALFLETGGDPSVVDLGTDPNPLLTVPPSDFGPPQLIMGFGPVQGTIHAIIIGSVSIDNVHTVVPVPAAVWLFGSGLLGLLATGMRKKTATLTSSAA